MPRRSHEDRCRGCGHQFQLKYGLCPRCRVTSPHRRPLHPKYKPLSRKSPLAIELTGSRFVVCGCDYMMVPLGTQAHSAVGCPNARIISISGHDDA